MILKQSIFDTSLIDKLKVKEAVINKQRRLDEIEAGIDEEPEFLETHDFWDIKDSILKNKSSYAMAIEILEPNDTGDDADVSKNRK